MEMNRRLLLTTAGALTLTSCSSQQVLDVALSQNPQKALQGLANRRVESYRYNPQLVLADLNKVKADFNRLMGNVQKESGEQWGKRESGTLPTRTRYVKYTEHYKNRVVVDYDAGTILIEHLDDDKVKEKLRHATVVALLTPGDPGAVDLFSDKEIVLTGQPYLQELVVDQNGAVIKTREHVERFADYLVGNRLLQRTIDANGSSKTVYYVQFSMVNSHIDKRALHYATTVRKNSESARVSRSLIYAITSIESAFNPYAVSSAPAYGMMQLVPTSGGREAYRKARGEDVIPSMEFLFVPENNIELGSTYLGVLLYDSPLRDIHDPVSREYCAIAAYNTGPGNVFRAFSSLSGRDRQNDALRAINAMRPDEVYGALRTKLPYEETRGYIANAVQAKKRYALM